jgi:NADH:ubiquinone oxidoreductase subunit F (NADH-binding)
MKILTRNKFQSWEKVKNLSSKKIINKVIESELAGRGGANFSTGKKWELSYPVKYLICNADESEPGTFKDKFILEHNPELLIEGINIAIKALKAQKTYIYLREEYKGLKPKFNKIIKKYSKYDIEVIIGAGAYICGEEMAQINSLEGRRAESRHKPPYPATQGLFNEKTCVNNVETFARLPLIWHDDFDPQLMLFAVSGDVENPGIYEALQGIRLADLLKEAQPLNPKAIFLGASGGCLPYDDSLILTHENIRNKGAMLGAGGIIVVSKKRSIVNICRSIIQFFVDENCGKCLPCREGNFRLLQLFQVYLKRKWTKEEFNLIQELIPFVEQGSQCALGQSSTLHLKTALKYFPKEFTDKVK